MKNVQNMYKNIKCNEETKDEILQGLLACRSIIVWGILSSVAADLSHLFPVSEVYDWLSPNDTPRPQFTENALRNPATEKDWLDDRSTSLVFLEILMSQDLQNADKRLQDGITKPNVQKIINRLADLLSFDIAIDTWLCICMEWLAICNVDEIVERLKENRPLPHDVNIAWLLVGAQEQALM